MSKKTLGRLQPKDLITVGIFSALYFALYFIIGMLAFVPAMVVVAPIVGPLVTGIPFMLFLTKVKRFGMVTIMGTLCGLLLFLGGMGWVCLPFGIVFGFLSDLVFKAGGYKGWKSSVAGYVVFSEWAISAVVPIFFMRDAYFAKVRDGWGGSYADSLLTMTPDWLLVVMVIMIMIGAIGGAYLGRAVLKKHFKRAGIA